MSSGRRAVSEKRLDDAIHDFTDALEGHPEDPFALLERGRAHHLAARDDAAAEDLTLAREHAGGAVAAQVWLATGIVDEARGKPADGKEAFGMSALYRDDPAVRARAGNTLVCNAMRGAPPTNDPAPDSPRHAFEGLAFVKSWRQAWTYVPHTIRNGLDTPPRTEAEARARACNVMGIEGDLAMCAGGAEPWAVIYESGSSFYRELRYLMPFGGGVLVFSPGAVPGENELTVLNQFGCLPWSDVNAELRGDVFHVLRADHRRVGRFIDHFDRDKPLPPSCAEVEVVFTDTFYDAKKLTAVLELTRLGPPESTTPPGSLVVAADGVTVLGAECSETLRFGG